MVWGPPLYLYTVEADDLANTLIVPDFQGRSAFSSVADPIAYRMIDVTNKTVQKLYHGTITAGNAASLESINDNADYQTTASATVIVVIQGNATTLSDCEIYDDTSANAAAGTQKEDFTGISMLASRFVTSKVLSFASGKYITVKANTGTITSANAWVIY